MNQTEMLTRLNKYLAASAHFDAAQLENIIYAFTTDPDLERAVELAARRVRNHFNQFLPQPIKT